MLRDRPLGFLHRLRGVTLRNLFWVLPAVLLVNSIPAQARAYREYDPMVQYQPDVAGDLTLSNTYPYWKDHDKPDPRLVDDAEENWKLNGIFMDPPFDSAIHGGEIALERGRKLFRLFNRKGRFANCLGARKGRLNGLRAHYPRYRADLRHVAGLEEAIEHCAARQGRVLENGSYDNSAVSLYLASKSNGMPMAIDVSKGPMRASYERGRKRFHLKAGAFNFACSSCHTHNVGRHLRGTTITTPYGDAGHYPVFRSQGILQSLQLRFAECNLDSRTQPLLPGSPAYTDLEVFLTALSNGYPIAVPSERE
jgi:sulfur-oxidizing protein SoxA